MKKIFVLLLFVVLAVPAVLMAAATAHTDVGSGNGFACGTCHAVHAADTDPNALGAQIPLWVGDPNGYTFPTGFTMYTVSASQGAQGQPSGTSRLCLSCHDGSNAWDNDQITDGSGADLTTDLSSMHPISFVYAAVTNEYKTADADMLDANNEVQCTSCHDIHNNNVIASALRYSAADNTLCVKCHEK